MTYRWIAAFLVGVLLGGTPSRAAAEPDADGERARAHYVDGITLKRAGDWRGALRELRTAYALTKHPRIAFDLGLVYVELADPVRATQMMKAALRRRTELDAETVARAREVIEEQDPAISVVVIETPVKGARVRINGRDVGKTPLGKPASVRSGVIDVELTAPGRAPAFATLTVKPGFQQNLELALDEPGAAAELEIVTDLPGAEILVDGTRRGITGQWKTIFVTPGEHEVTLRREGYDAETVKVTVAPRGVTQAELDAEPDPEASEDARGTLIVDVLPAEARVYLDGRAVEPGTIEVAPGPHEIRVEKALHLNVSRVVEVEAGERERVAIALPPTADRRQAILDEAEGQRSLVWAFGALGLGLSVGGIAVMSVGIVKNGDAKQTEDEVRLSRSCDLGEPECQAAIDDAQAEQGLGLGLALGGAGGLALGLGSFALSVWLYLDGQDPDALRVELPDGLATVRPDVVVTPGGSFLGLRGSF